MKKKIAILGSTGSIGKTLLDIVEKNKKNYEIILLTANKDHRLLLKQAKKFNVKNLILKDERSFQILKRSEETLGGLFSFFIIETILIAKALKINPYDQPAVELIKKETKKILLNT